MPEDIVSKARQFAIEKHKGQKRKWDYAKDDYVEHPIRVAQRAAKLGLSTVSIVAAFLHDVVEDCGVTIHELSAEFGAEVAVAVYQLTSATKRMDKEKREKLSRAERKKIDHDYIRGIDDELKVVKALDRLDNLREMGGAPSGFRDVYRWESVKLAFALQPTPGSRWEHLVEDLRLRIVQETIVI